MCVFRNKRRRSNRSVINRGENVRREITFDVQEGEKSSSSSWSERHV